MNKRNLYGNDEEFILITNESDKVNNVLDLPFISSDETKIKEHVKKVKDKLKLKKV